MECDPMPETAEQKRKRRLEAWRKGTQVPGFAPGTAPMILWPAQRQRADETLAVENLRRAYHAWRGKRRGSR